MRLNEEKENNIEEVRHFHWANITLIVFLFFSFLINLMIIIIHSKQKSIRRGFFTIIFAQIIMEAIINLSLLIMNIIYLTEIKKNIWFLILPILFNFGYVTNILYNIRIMLYLMTLNKRNEELINYDSKEEDDDLSRLKTVGFTPHSFKSFHIFCFLFSIIHTILYVFNLLNDEFKIESNNWKWFYYFMNGSDGIHRFAFFIFNYIYFILSIPYLILSLNKEKISDHILLKRFSLYCLFSSFISLLFPLAVLFDYIFGEKKEDYFIIIICAFIIYLVITWFFRVNCYYVQYILEENGKGFCRKCQMGFNILFRCKEIPSPNFIDLNSSYVYHSLANLNDFLQELSTDVKEEENNEIQNK